MKSKSIILSSVILCRPNQWIKNLFIFSPSFFSGNLINLDVFINSIIAVISFSFASSSIYILNDWIDREFDLLHPEKKNRPLAKGELSGKTALIISIFLVCSSLGISFVVNLNVFFMILIYMLLNVFYS